MRDLLADRAFARLFTAGLFAEIAEWMLQVALPVYIYRTTGSAGSTALTMVAGVLPLVLLSPVTGVLADRWDRRRTLCGVCLAQAVVVVPLLIDDGQLVIYLVMAAQAAVASLFEPTRNALLPALVQPERLTAANGLMGFTSSTARLLGSFLGGVVLGVGGLGWVVAGYLTALLLAGAVLLPRFAAATRTDAQPLREPMLRAWLDGIAEFRRRRELRVTGASLALAALAQGMFLVLFVLFVTGTLGGSDAEVGLLRGVQAVGGLAAGVVIATLARRVSPATLMGAGTLALGCTSLVIWNLPLLTTSTWAYAVLFGIAGAPGVLCLSGALTVIQRAVDGRRVGRVLSTTFAGMAAFQTVGTLLTGLLAGGWDLEVLLNVQATLLVVAGLVALLGVRSAHADQVERPAELPVRVSLARRELDSGDGLRVR